MVGGAAREHHLHKNKNSLSLTSTFLFTLPSTVSDLLVCLNVFKITSSDLPSDPL